MPPPQRLLPVFPDQERLSTGIESQTTDFTLGDECVPGDGCDFTEPEKLDLHHKCITSKLFEE